MKITDTSLDGVTVVSLAGELDLCTSPLVRDHLRQVIGEGCPVVVDLEPCEFMDAAGLGALVIALRYLRRAGGQRNLHVASPSQAVLRHFRVTGLTKVFPVHATAGEAAAAAREEG